MPDRFVSLRQRQELRGTDVGLSARAGALRQGGIFVSDDVEYNVALRDFSQQVSTEPIVVRKSDPYVGEKFIGLLVKRLS